MYCNLIKTINKNKSIVINNLNNGVVLSRSSNNNCNFRCNNSNNNFSNNNNEKRNYFTTPRTLSAAAASSSNSDSFIHKNKTSFDDIIDSQNTIEIRGVPSNITTRDIWQQFKDFKIVPHGIKMVFDGDIGFIYISFQTKRDFTRAVEMKAFTFSGQNFSISPLKSHQSNWADQKSDNSPRTSYLNRTAVTDHLWKSRKTKDQLVEENQHHQQQHQTVQIAQKLTTTSIKSPPILTTKIPIDSYTEVDLFFSSDMALREIYLSPYGHLRIGRLLEDLDALAGTVSFKHAENDEDTFKKTIVTASVDRISLLQPLIPDRDIKMEGVVTYVGKSSMEVMIKLSSKNNETQLHEPVLVAYFTMVARENGKASPVNHLRTTSDYEKKLFENGEKHKECRISHKQQSLDITTPTTSELQTIHSLFMTAKNEEKSSKLELIPMNDTTCQSVILCQPQERNINGNIFGGYLLRKGFETAFTTCFMKFNSSLPRFCAMDDITFLLPVEIGDILTLESTIVYSQPVPNLPQNYYAQVEVLAYVTNPYIGKKKLSNIFNFTFYCSPSGENTKPPTTLDSTVTTNSNERVKQILPSTYSEAMRFISGKRIVDRHLENEKSPDNLDIWSSKHIDLN
ncbi:hypothetical protein RB653_000251 [Dictyostelium firmibasis]|uniref:HotDog ACOT-type domain-containing protein n=1 Tax=Dictyostelium firmibasis TaxID=79012 RepID=A0AAN7YVS5_9MYCE